MKNANTHKAFFRLEASQAIGAGHAIRSLVIADALLEKGWQCIIATSETSYNFIEDLKRYERIDPQVFFQIKPDADLLVIDSYDLEYGYEAYFRQSIKKIMVIDDLANRNYNCDILLDQTYGRNPHDYKHLVPKECMLLMGSKNALIRKEFTQLRAKALIKRERLIDVKRILISLGGSDPGNHTLKALEIIKRSGFSGMVELVIGFFNQNHVLIETYLRDYPLKVDVHINPNMPKLTYESDLAIGAAGSSMWERCCLGLPTLMMVYSQDQTLIAQNLQNSNIAINLGMIDVIDLNDAAIKLTNLIEDISGIKKLSKNAFSICDGRGIDTIIKEIKGVH